MELGKNREYEERADWSEEDDHYLRGLVACYGGRCWESVADLLNEQFPKKAKSAKHCRERWYNKLNPKINHFPWTKQEEATLILAHMKYKNRWCDIVAKFKGRHNNMIKNRFYSIFRKVLNKIKCNNFTFSSKLELIENHYIISAIEYYASNPIPKVDNVKKRGKDFMYSLLKTIDFKSLQSYKEMLQLKCPLQSSMEDSLQEIISGDPLPKLALPKETEEKKSLASPIIFSKPIEISKQAKLLQLPEPSSFFSSLALTPDEKAFVWENSFCCSKLSTPASSLSPMQFFSFPFAPVIKQYQKCGNIIK